VPVHVLICVRTCASTCTSAHHDFWVLNGCVACVHWQVLGAANKDGTCTIKFDTLKSSRKKELNRIIMAQCKSTLGSTKKKMASLLTKVSVSCTCMVCV
jgi:hypothetical protein